MVMSLTTRKLDLAETAYEQWRSCFTATSSISDLPKDEEIRSKHSDTRERKHSQSSKKHFCSSDASSAAYQVTRRRKQNREAQRRGRAKKDAAYESLAARIACLESAAKFIVARNHELETINQKPTNMVEYRARDTITSAPSLHEWQITAEDSPPILGEEIGEDYLCQEMRTWSDESIMALLFGGQRPFDAPKPINDNSMSLAL